MRAFHRAIAAMLVFLLTVTTLAAADGVGEGKWTQLFNGKDLTGWKVKIKGYELGDNHANTFRVEDGVLKVAYDQYKNFDGKFGHIFYETPFSHFVLRVEYRFVGEQCPGGPGWAFRNSGVMIHGQSPESMGKDQEFPVSIEVQFLGGRGSGNRPTANVCSPGTHYVQNGKLVTQHCNNSTSKTFHGDQWVTVEVEVHGSKLIRHFVNGEKVFEYAQPQLDEKDPPGPQDDPRPRAAKNSCAAARSRFRPRATRSSSQGGIEEIGGSDCSEGKSPARFVPSAVASELFSKADEVQGRYSHDAVRSRRIVSW